VTVFVLMLDDDDDDDDDVGVGNEFVVEDGAYSPREALSCRDRGCWRRWRSHFTFLVVYWLMMLLLSFRCRCCH